MNFNRACSDATRLKQEEIMMNNRLFTLATLALILMVPSAFAEFVQSPFDAGDADTISISFTVSPGGQTNEYALQVDVYGLIDADSVSAANLGFGWDNSKATLDSARLAGVGASGLPGFSIL